MKRIHLAVLLAALSILPVMALADDAVDSRIKSIDDQLERDQKPAELDETKAKATFLAAHAKYCKSRAAACEKALTSLTRKAKLAKEAGDTKGVEACDARADELKNELEMWKSASAAKCEVKVEEAAADADAKDAKVTPKVGRWRRTTRDANGQEVMISASGAVLSKLWGPHLRLVPVRFGHGKDATMGLKMHVAPNGQESDIYYEVASPELLRLVGPDGKRLNGYASDDTLVWVSDK